MNSSKYSAFILPFIALPAVVYVVYRAWVLDFTYDECWTYLGYVHRSLFAIIANEDPAANNHILNTLLMKFSELLFGRSEFALRLPSIMAFLAYVVVVNRLVNTKTWLGVLIGASMIYQPYLLDYFVAARGYGLAITFTMAGVYFLNCFANEYRRTDASLTLVFGFLAAWSNFTFLLVFVSLVLGLSYVSFVSQKWNKVNLPIVIHLILALVFFSIPLYRLIKAQELYYGGNDGFYSDTVSSVASRMIYTEAGSTVLTVTLAVCLVACVMVLVVKVFRRERPKETGFWAMWILILCLLGNIAQHLVLGSPYLIDRTAIFVIPLVLLALHYLFDRVASLAFRTGLALGVFIWTLAIDVKAFNLNYLLDFKDYADTKAAVKWMTENRNELPDGVFEIGKSVYLNAPINYYKEVYNLQDLRHAGLEYCADAAYPIYYVFARDLDCLSGISLDTVRHFETSDTYLMLRKE